MTLTQIAFLDIETVPLFEKFSDMPVDGQEAFAKKVRNKVSGRDGAGTTPVLYNSMEEAYENEASLYAEFSRIVCIGLAKAFRKTPTELALQMALVYDPDEKVMLQQFIDLINKTRPVDITSDNPQPSVELPRFDFLCAHNGMLFDFPFMGRRMTVHGLPIPRLLDNRFKKPWETSCLDTNKIWQFSDVKYYTSLISLCYALGVPSPKGIMSGDQVQKHYWAGNIKGICNYCMDDVPAMVNCYCRLMGHPIFEPHQIITKPHQLIELTRAGQY